MQPQFPGQDPGVSAVQPGTFMTGPPLGQAPAPIAVFWSIWGPYPSQGQWDILDSPLHTGLSSSVFPIDSSHISVSPLSGTGCPAWILFLCAMGDRKLGGQGGGAQGIPHKLPLSRELSPARPFPHHLKMGASSVSSKLFTVGGAVWSHCLSYSRSLCQICLRVYICGKTGEL